jgi:5-oxoprolinase (ATP-hydrolysing)
MHGWRYPAHEQAAAVLARSLGFTQISVSHEVSPLMKLVSRGDTTVVDAYLSPILRRYVEQVAGEMPGVKQFFMQSSGGLTDAHAFQGKDAILSGPAGGIVGMVRTAQLAKNDLGGDKVIGFDMGGTSTDVSHFAGEFERAFETQVAGVRMRAPMMSIHTVAAGGGSILSFDGARFRAGPESAGANPGPACYRRGGPLAVTDANVMVGKIQPAFFPKVFGPAANEALDRDVVVAKFSALAAQIEQATGTKRSPEQVAEGFIDIAVGAMANAIKKISVARGYDVTRYTLQCFGGAGGQHACLVADALGMSRVFAHPLGGVLSAYGMGLAGGPERDPRSFGRAAAGRRAGRRQRATGGPGPRGRGRVAPPGRQHRWRATAPARVRALRRHRFGPGGAARQRGADPGCVRSRLPPAICLPDERAPTRRGSRVGRSRGPRRRTGRAQPCGAGQRCGARGLLRQDVQRRPLA